MDMVRLGIAAKFAAGGALGAIIGGGAYHLIKGETQDDDMGLPIATIVGAMVGGVVAGSMIDFRSVVVPHIAQGLATHLASQSLPEVV